MSDEAVGRYAEDNFETTYQKVGTFRVVDGVKQGGNVASYFCLSDGTVIHAVAGPLDARRYLQEMRWAADLRKLAAGESAGDIGRYRAVVRKGHVERLASESRLRLPPNTLPMLTTGAPPVPTADQILTPAGRALGNQGKVHALLAFAALTVPPRAAARQPVTLAEVPAAGDCFRYRVELDLAGRMVVTQDGAKQTIALEAKARHVFGERTLATADGLPARSARYYEDAAASAVVDVDKFTRSLPDDRRLVVALRGSDGPFCFSPAGPLTRDELDLVTEHFNPQCLAGLLPGKAVGVGDTWPVAPAAAQAAGQFDGLIRNDLTGKLTAAADGTATFAVGGTAEGIEHGAKVTLTVTATGTFDTRSKRITALTWKQKDDRGQGPVAPASQVEATVVLTREPLAAAPKELADAALAAVPKGDVPAALAALRHADPKGRYALVYARDWHITGQTDQHLVLRLLDRGEFVAQGTVVAWKKADAGKHTPADEFKKAASATPGWAATRVLEDLETAGPDGRWQYRLVAEGKSDDLPVVQSFHLVAGPQGDQAAVTFTMKPDKVKAVGTRDRDLVQHITVPANK